MKVIQFYQKRYIFFAISITIFIIGIAASFINGIQLDITFKGGAIMKYTYTGDLDFDKVASVAETTLSRKADATQQTSLASSEKTVSITLSGTDAITSQDQQKLTSALTEAFPNAKLTLSNALIVQPYIGKQFFEKGLFAIALAFFLILLYVAYRFKNIGGMSAGVMAIVALIHDCIVVATAFIVFKIPLNDSFIAAELSIIGFSINDTIVIYDRIRENSRILGSKMTTDEMVNRSITQSMTRSLNTNIAVFVSITIVFIFAQIFNIDSVRTFALPMMFGTVSGCYSTICIAGPLWTMWQLHKKKVKAARA